ncbi:PLDc N-terminal domain-containing protein, partial [Variovorax sp. CT11-76]
MPKNGFDWLPSPSQHFLVVTFALLVYVLTTRARREQRAPTTAIAWVMGLVLLPYLILPMYLLFGQRKLRPAGSARKQASISSACAVS